MEKSEKSLQLISPEPVIKDISYDSDNHTKTFQKSDLLTRRRVRKGERTFNCDICGKSFPSNNDLVKHKRIHIGEKPYRCDICGKAFSRNSNVTVQKRIHTGEKPFNCDICDKSFSNSSHLIKRRYIHTGKKPYQCDICGKSFSQRIHITQHKRVHAGEKRYRCDTCGKSFFSSSALISHRRIHRGEKPCHCDICGKAFSNNAALTSHRRIHSEETSYHCHIRGSHLEAVHINMQGAFECTSQFDPRPPIYRNHIAYQSYFRNICLNFGGISKMPIFQIFPPANALAASHDHDYLKETPEDSFLRDIGILGLAANERTEIQEQTLGHASSDIWHKEWQKRIHSSDFGRICKATERTNFKELAHTLMIKEDLTTEAILCRKKYEQDAIRRYEVDNNVHVSKCGIFVCKDYSFLGASPDGIVDGNVLCDVKCPSGAQNKKISTDTVPYLRQDINGSLSLDPTHEYYFQIQGDLLCSERSVCDFIVYTLVDVKHVRIYRDDKFIKDMIEKLQSFYENYFEAAILEKQFYKPFNGF